MNYESVFLFSGLRNAFAIVAASIIIGSPTIALADVVVVVNPTSSSPIEISRATSFIQRDGSATECVFFVNKSKVAASRIHFVFTAYLGAEVLQTDVFDRRGKISPDINFDGLDSMRQLFSGSGRARTANCRDTFFKKEPSSIHLSIESADFEDGSHWITESASPAARNPEP